MERIIDWFDTEERKEAMAKIILNDAQLKQDFNYGGTYNPGVGLKYGAIAKVAILLFADYIHETFIENGPGWIQTTWNWLMGSQTLVDVVALAFTGVSTAINAVKNVASAALNAVKVGLEYIANAVLGPMIDATVSIYRNLLIATAKFFEVIGSSFLDISYTTNGVAIDGRSIEVYRDGLDMIIDLNGFKLPIELSFYFPTTNHETLGEGADGAAIDSMIIFTLNTFIFALSLAADSVGIAKQNAQNNPGKYVNPKSKINILNNWEQYLVTAWLLGFISYPYVILGFYDDARSQYNEAMEDDYFSEWIENWFYSLVGRILALSAKKALVAGPIARVMGTAGKETIAETFEFAFATNLADLLIGETVDFSTGGSAVEHTSNGYSFVLGMFQLLLGYGFGAVKNPNLFALTNIWETWNVMMDAFFLFVSIAYLLEI